MSQVRESVWALSRASVPFFREGIEIGKEEGSKWVQLDGLVEAISVSVSGTVWAIMHDKVYVRAGVTPNCEPGTHWAPMTHEFQADKLAAGGCCMWVYTRENRLYVRTGMAFHSNKLGDNWKSIETPTNPNGIADMALTANDDLFVLTDCGKIYKREGCTPNVAEGVNWAKVALPKTGGGGFLGLGSAPAVKYISAGIKYLWCVTDSHDVWRSLYNGVINANSWERLHGQKMCYVAPSMSDEEIAWGINNRDQMYIRTSPQSGRYEWLRQGTVLFGTVSVGTMVVYTAPAEKSASGSKLARAMSNVQTRLPKVAPAPEELHMNDVPFKIEECGAMDQELLNALVIPILTEQDVLNKFNYDFNTEETVLSLNREQ